MDSQKAQAVLDLVESARKQADALIVVGILPGGAIFQSTDPRISMPDLRGELQRSVDFICQCVSRNRARIAKQKAMGGKR